MARRALTCHERETRLHRLIIGAVALAFLVVLLVPAVGYYREVLTKGAQPIAQVEGETIDLDTFSKVYGYRQISLDAQLNQMRQFSTELHTPSPHWASSLPRIRTWLR